MEGETTGACGAVDSELGDAFSGLIAGISVTEESVFRNDPPPPNP